ncbi:hypothetical protein [Gordonia amicalis]|uniref:hypothetical protein n=1 Tax=Gordonia amicalis TaxID=89053 RepID=UPI0002A65369|nr:hypothetical protein [Gordonia amicalis]MDV7099765.1 hypothetical protein [Gordonia amicalis]MDV7171878.1 hypothetical protein [Gordonia amicalis]UKO91106.1 hypothetical protein IHQ52_19205 [Gordonia amicalis]UOG22575.1 hypothetical protein MTX80_06170 [Gordonia amicalis]GAC51844.1 Mce family protein [Gordonia amicalis NBRC 100051 = JCM 11271]
MFADKRKEIGAVFTDDGVHYFTGVAKSAVAHISTLLPSIGSVFIGGLWLVPMLESAATLVESGRGEFDAATGAEAATTVTNFLRNTLLPWASRPQGDIRTVKAAGGHDELVDDATTILRMLGAIR